MTILPAGSATRHWLNAGLALGLAATCQAGMVVKTDPPARQASPASTPAALAKAVAPATQKMPAKAAGPAPSSPAAPSLPAPAAQGHKPARASVKAEPLAADRPLARPSDRTVWPVCIRQLNAAALSGHWDAERRQALLEQCPS